MKDLSGDAAEERTEIVWDGDSILEPDIAGELTTALTEAFVSQFIFRGALRKKWATAFAYNYLVQRR
jgi:hypothetical protein